MSMKMRKRLRLLLLVILLSRKKKDKCFAEEMRLAVVMQIDGNCAKPFKSVSPIRLGDQFRLCMLSNLS